MTQLTYQAVKARLTGEFQFRNSGAASPHDYEEYQRERRGFLQRIVLYGTPDALAYAVLRTKAAPSGGMFTLYDVEHLMSKGVDGLSLLLDVAEQHLEQFELSGAPSFFAKQSTAEPHQSTRYAVELTAPG